jgi:hypothetical protein
VFETGWGSDTAAAASFEYNLEFGGGRLLSDWQERANYFKANYLEPN